MKSTSNMPRFEVSKTGKICDSLNAALNCAQRYCEHLTEVGTCYVFPLGENKAVARVERESDGAVVTYANGKV